jgi:streptomycin 6-kinase
MSDDFLAGLPPKFLDINAGKRAWLRRLPSTLAQLAERWSLTVGPHFPGLSYDYVAPATRANGPPCVLKIGKPGDWELRTGIEALRLFDGRGACRLLESDWEVGAALLERIEPGTTLVETAERDDDEATRIAAGVLRELWRPLPPEHQLRTLESWFRGFERHGDALRRGDGGYPAALFERAAAMLPELLESTKAPVALHGDVHHFNILWADPGPARPEGTWLLIDPKGLAGDRHFDVCQFLVNPDEMPLAVIRRRLDIFSEELGLDRHRTQQWAVLHAVLSSCWAHEEGRERWRQHVARAEALLAG